MLTTVRAVVRDNQIELREPVDIADSTETLVTLLDTTADDDLPPAPGEFLYDLWKDRIGRINGPEKALSENTGAKSDTVLRRVS